MTSPSPHILIFTDLDGTLLDHHDYSLVPADTYIAELSPDQATVIPITSKTRVEVQALIASIAPIRVFASENGSAVHAPQGFPWGWDSDSQIEVLGLSHDEILARLNGLNADLRAHIRGFSDMTIKEIAAETGLDLQSASKAKAREASEPFLWTGPLDKLHQVREAMDVHGIKVQQGGRFYHLTGACGKADAMDWIARQYRSANPDGLFVTVALGDGPNDLEMIEQADRGVIIPNPDGPVVQSGTSSVILASKPGPDGWVDAVRQILDELDSDNNRKH